MQIGDGDVEGWSQPENDAGEERYAQGEGEHPAVHSDVLHAGKSPGHGRHHCSRAPAGEGQPGDTTGERQHQAFGEQLADHSAAAGADGGADGDFLLALGGAGQEQVRHVRAGDQEHETHRAQQHQQGGPDVPDDYAGEWRDIDAMLGVRFRIGFGQAGRDGSHFRLGLDLRHSGLEPPHYIHSGMHFARPGQEIVPLFQERVDVGVTFKLKAGGNDAGDGIAPAVEPDLAAEHGGV